MDPVPEITSAEAVQKTKEAAEAVETARMEQMNSANMESEKRITAAFTEALKQTFETDDTESGQKKFIDITRIPLICKDISDMKTRIGNIDDNLKWGVRIVLGAVIVAVIGLVLK